MGGTPHSVRESFWPSLRGMKENQTLPTCESASASPPYKTNPLNHILVVEDDDGIRNLNVEALERAGYQVDDAVDGAAAWQTLNRHGYDLMITDQNMPGVSGVELLKKIHAAHMSMPVIMASGNLPTAEFTRCPWLRPSITLQKPYTLQELLEAVRTIFKTESNTAHSQLLPSQDLDYQNIAQVNETAVASQKRPVSFAHRILVVDKDSDLRLLYTDVLGGHGYKVDEAEDGGVAWETLQAKDYNLLITEHDLPKLTGIQLVRKLRAARMALPVVMAATTLPTHELHRDLSLQFAATLEKPFVIDDLVNTVKCVLHAPVSPVPNWQNEPTAPGFKL